MTPTLGRIVHYKLSEGDVREINRRRVAHASMNKARGEDPLSVDVVAGAQMHVGNTVIVGMVFPMMVVSTYGSTINGQVFLDGNDTFWALSRMEGDEPSNWFWPPKV